MALPTSGLGNVTLTGSSSTLTISSVISGNTGLQKLGTGTLTLTGANTYTNQTVLTQGVLSFANGSLGPCAIVMNGGTLQWASGNTQDVSVSPYGLSFLASSTLDTSSNNVTLAGNIYNPVSWQVITKIGSGTLTLSGANTYTGPTTINAGTLAAGAANAFSSSSAVTVASGAKVVLNGHNESIGSLTGAGAVTDNSNTPATLTVGNDNTSPAAFSGAISTTTGSNTGALSLTKVGSGTLTLGGAGNTYTGATAVNSGTLIAGAANTIYSSSAVSVASGATFVLNGFSQSIGSLTGAGNVTNNSNTAATLTVGNDNTSPAAFSGVLSDTTGSNTGALSLTKVGSGTLTLSGTNTYSGVTGSGTTINGGILNINGDAALGTAPTSAMTNITFGGNATLQFAVPITSITLSMNRNITIGSGDAATFDMVANGGTTVSYAGVISGLGSLVNASSSSGSTGVLNLSGPNTYSGGTTINSGTLKVNADAALGATSSNITFAGSGRLNLAPASSMTLQREPRRHDQLGRSGDNWSRGVP